MKSTLLKNRLGSRGKPEQSRSAILQAAVREFSREGVAGARIDAIARAARVNKALLYYYFTDKEALYGAVLDDVFGGLHEAVHRTLAQPLPPRDRILAYTATHFDYIASNPLYPRIVQGEMMRAGSGSATQFERIVKQYFRPLFAELSKLIVEGISAGEFRAVDPMQFIPTMIATIVFYFTSVPVIRLMTDSDPLAPERLAARRAAVMDFISAALFRSTSEGGRSEPAQ
jgi:TetR/AcrR family transcriptional regulator